MNTKRITMFTHTYNTRIDRYIVSNVRRVCEILLIIGFDFLIYDCLAFFWRPHRVFFPIVWWLIIFFWALFVLDRCIQINVEQSKLQVKAVSLSTITRNRLVNRTHHANVVRLHHKLIRNHTERVSTASTVILYISSPFFIF